MRHLKKSICINNPEMPCKLGSKRNLYTPNIWTWPSGLAAPSPSHTPHKSTASTLAFAPGSPSSPASQIWEYPPAIALIQPASKALTSWDITKKRSPKRAIVANLGKPCAESSMKLLPFAPDACAWSFAVGYRKSEEGIYRHACTMLGVTTADVLMVDDSLENDNKTPKELGMQARYLNRSGNNEGMPECVKGLSEILA